MILKLTTRVRFEGNYWFATFIKRSSLGEMLLLYPSIVAKNPDFKLDLVI